MPEQQGRGRMGNEAGAGLGFRVLGADRPLSHGSPPQQRGIKNVIGRFSWLCVLLLGLDKGASWQPQRVLWEEEPDSFPAWTESNTEAMTRCSPVPGAVKGKKPLRERRKIKQAICARSGEEQKNH
jgi:hypothetical protein